MINIYHVLEAFIHIGGIYNSERCGFCYMLWSEKSSQAVGNVIISVVCYSPDTQLYTSTFSFSANVLCGIKLHSWNSWG